MSKVRRDVPGWKPCRPDGTPLKLIMASVRRICAAHWHLRRWFAPEGLQPIWARNRLPSATVALQTSFICDFEIDSNQNMESKSIFLTNKWFVFSLLAVLATAAKAGLSVTGSNYDPDSFAIIADFFLDGKNLYAETGRYNYGPVWGYVVGALRYLQGILFDEIILQDFHLMLALFLSLVDIALGVVLWRLFSFKIGCVFLINPVSILLTGYHSQFENLALLPGIMACGLLTNSGKDLNRRFLLGVLLLGISLSVKHFLFMLPVWFLFNSSLDFRQRIVACVGPFLIFGASFLPFVIGNPEAFEGVIQNVLKYSSNHLGGFYPRFVNLFFPVKFFEKAFSILPAFAGFKFIWIVTLLGLGWLVKNKQPLESCLIYLIAVCVTSSALADQYLAIPVISCIVFWKHPAIRWYMYLATIFLATSPANIGSLQAMKWLAAPTQAIGLRAWHPVAALFIFLVWYFCRPKLQWSSKASNNTDWNVNFAKLPKK